MLFSDGLRVFVLFRVVPDGALLELRLSAEVRRCCCGLEEEELCFLCCDGARRVFVLRFDSVVLGLAARALAARGLISVFDTDAPNNERQRRFKT